MFFKKKVDVEVYCSACLMALFASERESGYERLRQDCADPALSAVDQNLYFDHIRAVVVQLLLYAIRLNCNRLISFAAHVIEMEYLKDHGLSHIDILAAGYGRAFGSSCGDGVAGIVASFSEQLTDSQMQPETMKRYYGEFCGIFKGFMDDFKSLKLTTTP